MAVQADRVKIIILQASLPVVQVVPAAALQVIIIRMFLPVLFRVAQAQQGNGP